MKRTIPYLAGAALMALAGTSIALAGGAQCAEQHNQAGFTKMAEKMASSGWLGIEKEKDANGNIVVKAITAGGPAAAAGFRVGDVLVALNGVNLKDADPAAMTKAKASMGVGKAVTYTVARGGSQQQLTATLGPVPDDVLAQWVGHHVLDNHTTVAVATKN